MITAGQTGARTITTLAAVTLAVALSAGCTSESESAGAPEADSGKPSTPQSAPLEEEALKAALPNQFNVPEDVSEERIRKTWDTTDPIYCQSEGWPDEWCAKADFAGAAGFTNLDDQELVIRLISFPDIKTAAALFKGEGTPDEVGENPPGDEIDGFDIDDPNGASDWTGHGINVRQGAVIGKIEYTWKQGTFIPSGRLASITAMVVKRVQQAQHGETPIASAR
ncbi:hypothetical protein [Streptomyces sp. NBC_00859]|uniref:hypothetical protein n=1 Tax=Streptomyces sp. NBC_00859 TaxID=2903682 RepID=UPI003866322C|nr:hypothetical protein OG584_32330 [Streptomyces sp. NBC_00859]